jgi:hypothetical protein
VSDSRARRLVTDWTSRLRIHWPQARGTVLLRFVWVLILSKSLFTRFAYPTTERAALLFCMHLIVGQ